MNPFEGYKIYGPIYHKRIDRYMVSICSKNHKTSMTYARYLMCVKEGRWLEEHEQVDHIDNDRKNDVIENLQILSRSENMKKSAKPKTMITKNCEWCDKEFTRRTGNAHKTCSRSCGGKLSHVTKKKNEECKGVPWI